MLHPKDEKDENWILNGLVHEAKQEPIDIKKIISLIAQLSPNDLFYHAQDFLDQNQIKNFSAWNELFCHSKLKDLMSLIHKYSVALRHLDLPKDAPLELPKAVLEAKDISDLEKKYETAIKQKFTELNELRILYNKLHAFYLTEPTNKAPMSEAKLQELLNEIKRFGADQLKLPLAMGSGKPKSIYDLVINPNNEPRYRNFSDIVDQKADQAIKEKISAGAVGSLPVAVKENKALTDELNFLEKFVTRRYFIFLDKLLKKLETPSANFSAQESQNIVQKIVDVLSLCKSSDINDQEYARQRSPDDPRIHLIRKDRLLDRMVRLGNTELVKATLARFNSDATVDIDLNKIKHSFTHPLLVALESKADDETKQQIIKILISSGAASPEGLTLPVEWKNFVNTAYKEYVKDSREVVKDKLGGISPLSALITSYGGFFDPDKGDAKASDSVEKDKKSEPPTP